MHHFVLRHLPRPSRRCRHHHHGGHYRTLHDAAAASSIVSSINWVRDRALDHAVEKERDLKTMINLKNLINSEPSKALPLSIISDNKQSLRLPIRPIDFIRKYPSIFEEFLPGGIGIHPHVKLTPEILNLDAQEQLLFDSEIHKQDVANRLLKMLMIARINKIPLCIIDRFKWDLGLPNDYTQSVVPQFPDYFQVNGNELELVCWSDNLAVSVMEKNELSSFPIQYSRGFEINKKFKKWVDGWQKLPLISPYENPIDLQKNSDESDKWAVGLLHEVLNLLVPRKIEKDNLLVLGEYLGVRSRFKRALLQHPGIFYVSSKLGNHTVVLREAYKRDLLVSKVRHPLMELRSKYIHLMNTIKKETKTKNLKIDGPRKQKGKQDSIEEEDGELGETGEDETDSEVEGVSDGDSDDDWMEGKDMVVNGRRPAQKMESLGRPALKVAGKNGGRMGRNRMVDEYKDSGVNQRFDRRKGGREPKTQRFLKTEALGARKAHGRSLTRSGVLEDRS